MGESHLTWAGPDLVCESTPFLQATSGYPAEGMTVKVGPTYQEILMSRRKSGAGAHWGGDSLSKAARDNRADQLNPNNDKFYRSRGLQGRPDKPGGEKPVQGPATVDAVSDIPGR